VTDEAEADSEKAAHDGNVGTAQAAQDGNGGLSQKLPMLPLLLFALTIAAVLVGGNVRIEDAGEACPDWPQCFGTWGFEVSAEEQGQFYADNPEEIPSKGEGHRFTTEQIFLEWFHRLLTGLILGPLCILQWVLTFRRRAENPQLHLASSAVLIFVIIQGGLGAVTVRLDNAPLTVTAHLLFSMILASSLLWTWLQWQKSDGGLPSWATFSSAVGKIARPRLLDASISVLIAMLLGALVAATEQANTACGVATTSAWPLCQGAWIPNMAAHTTSLQFVHRIAILFIFIWMIWHIVQLKKQSDNHPEIKRFTRWLHASFGLFGLNALLGGAYILTWEDGSFIEHLSLIHLLLASASLLTVVFATMLAHLAITSPSSDGISSGEE
jgi:heme A synthase